MKESIWPKTFYSNVKVETHYASLSEAIREGAKTGPQAFSSYFEDEVSATCAMGAAMVACFGRETCFERDVMLVSVLDELYQYLNSEHAWCPVVGCEDYADIEDTITHLNDTHEWTREQIADWVEREEEKIGFVLLTEEAPELSLDPSTCKELAGVGIEKEFSANARK